jgi:hypothetical protein
MNLTTCERARLALVAGTCLTSDATLDLVRAVAVALRPGVSLLGTGPVGLGARIVVVPSSTAAGAELCVLAEPDLTDPPLCRFPVVVSTSPGGTTGLRVGGLAEFQVFAVRNAPDLIAGYDVYSGFLRRVAARLTRADPAATAHIGWFQ